MIRCCAHLGKSILTRGPRSFRKTLRSLDPDRTTALSIRGISCHSASYATDPAPSGNAHQIKGTPSQELSPETFRELFRMAVEQKRDWRDATEYKRRFEQALKSSATVAQKLPAVLLLDYIALLSRALQCELVVREIENLAKSTNILSFIEKRELQNVLNHVLKEFAAAKEPNAVKSIIDAILNVKLLSPHTRRLWEPWVQAHLNRREYKEAIDALEYALQQTTSVSHFGLLKTLIEREDVESLQRVVNIMTSRHAKNGVLCDLAVAFLACGKVKEAENVFALPGLTADNERLRIGFERLMALGDFAAVEKLFELSKGLLRMEVSRMAQFVLQAFSISAQLEKANVLIQSLLKDNVKVDQQTAQLMVSLLNQQQKPVPPALAEIAVVVTPPAGDLVVDLMRYVNQNKTREAYGLWRRAAMDNSSTPAGAATSTSSGGGGGGSSGGVTFDDDVLSKLGVCLLNNFAKREIREFAYYLSENGKVAIIEQLAEHPNAPAFVRFRNELFRAFVAAGRMDEMVTERWRKEPRETKYYLHNDFDWFVKEYPDRLEQLIEIAEQCAESGDLLLLQRLCAFYLKTNQIQQAEDLLKKRPELKRFIPVERFIRQCVEECQSEPIESSLRALGSDNMGLHLFLLDSLLLCHLRDNNISKLEEIVSNYKPFLPRLNRRTKNQLRIIFDSHGVACPPLEVGSPMSPVA